MPIDPPPGWQPQKLAAKVSAGAQFAQTQFCMDKDIVRRYGARLKEHAALRDFFLLVGVAPLRSAKSARWMRSISSARSFPTRSCAARASTGSCRRRRAHVRRSYRGACRATASRGRSCHGACQRCRPPPRDCRGAPPARVRVAPCEQSYLALVTRLGSVRFPKINSAPARVRSAKLLSWAPLGFVPRSCCPERPSGSFGEAVVLSPAGVVRPILQRAGAIRRHARREARAVACGIFPPYRAVLIPSRPPPRLPSRR